MIDQAKLRDDLKTALQEHVGNRVDEDAIKGTIEMVLADFERREGLDNCLPLGILVGLDANLPDAFLSLPPDTLIYFDKLEAEATAEGTRITMCVTLTNPRLWP